MTPKIQKTPKGHITIWEQGICDKFGYGRVHVIGGATGQKLAVVYDKYREGYVFAVDPIATHIVYVERRPVKGKAKQRASNYTVSLQRLESVTTEIVQGEALIKPVIKDLWFYKGALTEFENPEIVAEQLVAECKRSLGEDYYKPFYGPLITAGVTKASSKQWHLAWGIPRKVKE